LRFSTGTDIEEVQNIGGRRGYTYSHRYFVGGQGSRRNERVELNGPFKESKTGLS